MSDYDLKVHPFPPALIYPYQKPSALPAQQLTTDTCATEREPLSRLAHLQLEPSTDERKITCGTTLMLDKSEATRRPLGLQIGGKHYKAMKIQPVEYIHANQIPFIEGSIIKYLSRWRDKGGVQDLQKAKHFIDLLIELENNAK